MERIAQLRTSEERVRFALKLQFVLHRDDRKIRITSKQKAGADAVKAVDPVKAGVVPAGAPRI